MTSTLTLDDALFATRALAAFAIFLQTFELFALRRSWSDAGVWAWPVLRRDFASTPHVVRAALDAVLGARGFAVLLALRLALSTLAAFTAWAWPALFVANVLTVVRFRGSFNGGSDSMTLVVSSALAAHALFGATDFGAVVALGYIAFHSLASYVVAGLAKLSAPLWRRGDAARVFVVTSTYPVPPSVRAFASDHTRLVRTANYAVVAFELAFPLVLVRPFTLPMLALGLGFHLANYALFGLNRFVWAWLATYPALALFGLRGLG